MIDARGVGACRREVEGLARERDVHGNDEGCDAYDEADGDGAGDPEGESRGEARHWSSQSRCYHVLNRGMGSRVRCTRVAALAGRSARHGVRSFLEQVKSETRPK